jgi:hypothetical protein
LTGQTLLQCVLSGTQIDELVAYDVLVPLERVEQEVTRYVRDLSVEERKAFMTLFKITGYRSEDRTGWLGKAAFGISVARQLMPETKAYNVKFKNDSYRS